MRHPIPARPVVAALALAAVTAACSQGAAPGIPCDVTRPDGSFSPPAGYPPEPPAIYASAWYGTAALWTMLHHEGERWADLPRRDGLLGNKLVFWADGYDVADGPTPELTVRARRLDAPGAASHPAATNGMVPDVGWFIVTGIEFPAPGCWELTASYRGAELTYVVEVL